MVTDALTYMDIITARWSIDPLVLSALSLRLAVQRLRATGRDHAAVVRVPQDAVDRECLDRVLRSLGLGRIVLRVTWEQPNAVGRHWDLLLLVPVADLTVVGMLEHRAVVVGTAVNDADELTGAIRGMRQGWRVVAVDMRPGSFIEGLSEMVSRKLAM